MLNSFTLDPQIKILAKKMKPVKCSNKYVRHTQLSQTLKYGLGMTVTEISLRKKLTVKSQISKKKF